MHATRHKVEKYYGEVFCLECVPVQGRNLDIEESKREKITGL